MESGQIHIAASFALILLSAALLAGCMSGQAESGNSTPIRISANYWAGDGVLFVAKDKGFFARNGVDVEIVYTQEYADAMALHRRGGVDGIAEVFSDTIIHNSEGNFERAVMVLDYSTTGDAIVARGEINNISDLKGRKIGILGLNTFSHVFVLQALERAGLGEGDVQFVIIAAKDAADAIANRTVDAAETSGVGKRKSIDAGYNVISSAGDFPGLIADVLTFRGEVISGQPDKVQAIVRSLMEAQQFMASNPDEANKIIASNMDATPGEIASELSGMQLAGLSENIALMDKENNASLYVSGEYISKFLSERGQMGAGREIGGIIDPSFVKRLG